MQPKSRRTGFHGLPAEYYTPDGESESWEDVLGYLGALESSGRPVVLATEDSRLGELNPGVRLQATKQIGFLQCLPLMHSGAEVHRFGLNWPDPDQPCGEFVIDQRLVEGARLGTADGDDYFRLALDLGPVALAIVDSNTNMDQAYEEWARRQHRSYLSLPSAREVEEKWRAETNAEVVKQRREELAALRRALVERGSVVASEMSDAELAAASERVSWRLRTSGRMSKVHHSGWKQMWFDELASDLGADAPGDA
jgi:hypothetical protein